jgi:ubiquinone/menaquinone biosynthesis C-methylase UbiE
MSDGVANFFVHRSAAQRYARARPYFHPLVMQRIVAFTRQSRFGRALDVACGTGLSSQALLDIADEVDATDISPEMLAEVPRDSRVRFQLAPAERLPFDARTFDLLTVGLAFHWFDQAAFLDEAHRLLKPSGWLVIYTSGFDGEMTETDAFREWAWEIYPKKFPSPPRRSVGVSAELLAQHGFELRANERFTHEEKMTADQLTAYLLTQTNVIAAVEDGSIPIEAAARWIHDGIAPFFDGQPRTMKFSGSIWFIQRNAQP